MAEASIGELVMNIMAFLKGKVIPLLFALATVIFIWGVIQYVVGSQGSETRIETGKKVMIWGIIGLAIMTSAWAIVAILCGTFVQWGGAGTCPT